MFNLLDRRRQFQRRRIGRKNPVSFVHVGNDPLDDIEAWASSAFKAGNQLRLSGRFAPKGGGRHFVAGQKGADTIEQFGFGDDLHASPYNSAFTDIASLLSANASLPVDKSLCEITYMQSGENALYARLMAIKPAGLSLNAWAVKAGVTRTFFNDVRKRGNARHDSLVKLLAAAGVSLSEFDDAAAKVQSEVRGTAMSPAEVRDAWSMSQPARSIPLLGTAFGTELEDLDQIETTELMMSEVLDYVARPPSLANDGEAYAVTVIGDSQAPRFEAGELAFVSPKAPVNVGDDVLVQLRAIGDDDEGSQVAGRISTVLLKRLVKRTGAFLELRQFNPDKTFRVPIERVRRVHRVKGRL